MATVVLWGNAGSVTWSDDTTVQTTILAWTMDASVEIIDTTSTDDDTAGYRTKTVGRKDWSATVDTLNTGIDPTKLVNAAASLTLDDGSSTDSLNLVLANAMCTGGSISLDTNDVEKTTFNFVCAGAI